MRPERFKVISVLDEAIDTGSMPFETLQKYIETRDVNIIAPHLKPGVMATVYNVRAVPHSLWESYVMAGGDHDDIRFRRAFMAGVESVEGLRGDDGVALPSKWTGTRKVNDRLTMLTEDECNERFAPSEVLEIGSVVYKHSFLPRRIALSWVLPSSCVEPLAQRTFRSVEASPSTASTTTNSQPSGTEQPMVTASS